MKPINDWENVAASDYKTLVPGGYICVIKDVINDENKHYLHILYDIADGDLKGYWDEYASRSGSWRGDFYRSYKDSAAGMFKGFINAVEKSNPSFTWAWDEKALIGKLVGLVIGDEEYISTDGSVKTWPKVKNVKTVNDIKEGRFRVPETKKIEEESATTPPETVSVEEMPF